MWSTGLTLWGALLNLLFTMDYDLFTTQGGQTCRKRFQFEQLAALRPLENSGPFFDLSYHADPSKAFPGPTNTSLSLQAFEAASPPCWFRHE